MTTALLQHEEFGELRMQEVDGEPWFAGKDVCQYFGDTHYRRAIRKLDEDEKGVTHMDTPGGKQEMLIINESGLYHLLFAMQPQKSPNSYVGKRRVEQVRNFRKWVTSEVLPSIRKTGVYAKPPHDTESNFARPAVTQMIAAHVHHCLFLLASDTAEIRTRELRSRMLATIHSAYDVLNYKFLKINPKEINR